MTENETVTALSAIYYDTVADMQADENLGNETVCITLGYYTANDGGGATYKTRVKATSDEERIHCIVCANVTAEIVVENDTINVLQFGLKNDGSQDCSSIFSKIVASDKWYNIYFPSGKYAFYSPLVISPSYPNHRIYGNMPHIHKNWDNYLMASHLLYYPQQDDTTFITLSGSCVEMEKLYIQCMQYGKNTTGFDFRGTRSKISYFRILDFDNVSLYLDAPYSVVEMIHCEVSTECGEYIDEDKDNRKHNSLCEINNASTACNMLISGLTLGSPTYCYHENGLIIGGIGNKITTLFMPGSAIYPIVFKSTSNACSLENSYFEQNSIHGHNNNFVIFESGSKNNVIGESYMSGFFTVIDNGLLNVVKNISTALGEIAMKMHFEKLSRNMMDVQFVDNNGIIEVSSTSTQNGFSWINMSGTITNLDEEGFVVCDGTVRNILDTRLKTDSIIGEYLRKGVYIVYGAEIIDIDSNVPTGVITLPRPQYYNSSSDNVTISNTQQARYFKDSGVIYNVAKIEPDLVEEYTYILVKFFDCPARTGTYKFKPFFYIYCNGNSPVELP